MDTFNPTHPWNDALYLDTSISISFHPIHAIQLVFSSLDTASGDSILGKVIRILLEKGIHSLFRMHFLMTLRDGYYPLQTDVPSYKVIFLVVLSQGMIHIFAGSKFDFHFVRHSHFACKLSVFHRFEFSIIFHLTFLN